MVLALIKSRRNMGKPLSWLKMLLLVWVALFAIINYYAFKELVFTLMDYFNIFARTHGYYFDITKPLSLFLDLLPGLGLIRYLVTMNNKNALGRIQEIYNAVTIWQLIILTITMPLLLFYQNKFYGKVINTSNGTE